MYIFHKIDYFLWQIIDFPTRHNSLLNLLLTTIPGKINHIEGCQDILNTDHQLVKICIKLRIAKKARIKRQVYNFKKADWQCLKQFLWHIPWDVCFVEDNIKNRFLSAVDQHIPKCKARYVNDHSKTQTWSIPILALFRSTTKINKNSLLTRSISHLVPKIFWFLKNANEILYDVIYSINSVKDEYLRE